MNGQRAMAVVLLVGSLFVLGTLSASLDATVSSAPDDVVDVDTDSLPFVGDGASEIAHSYKSAEEGNEDASVSNGDGSTEPAGGGSSGDAEGGAGSDGSPAAGSDGSDSNQAPRSDGDGEDGSAGQDDAGGAGGTGEDDAGSGPGDGVADSLWDLLAQYLVLLLTLLALLAVLAVARAVARRRERLLARLRALAEQLGLLPPPNAGEDVAVPDGEGEAATVVERAWAEMLHASGARPPPGDTPRECAEAAVEAGADPDAVAELTEMYERVRYGDGSVTAADASRALECAREITPDDGRPTIDGEPTADGDPAVETGPENAEGHA